MEEEPQIPVSKEKLETIHTAGDGEDGTERGLKSISKSMPEDYSTLDPESDSENEDIELTPDQKHTKELNYASMLERALKPKKELAVKIIPHGIFNIPEKLLESEKELKEDFGYRVKIWGKTVDFGKIYEREMTEEEIANLKNKKKKKKGEEEEVVEEKPVDPEYEKLSDEEKMWLEYEDKYKHGALRWTKEYQDERLQLQAESQREELIKQMKEELKQKKKLEKKMKKNLKGGTQMNTMGTMGTMNTFDLDFNEDEVEIKAKESFRYDLDRKDLDLLDKSLDDGGLYVIFERYVDVDEEELQKLKKKYKGRQYKELNVLKCKVWISLEQAQVPGSKYFLTRGKIEQIIEDPESEEECNQYDFSNSYFKIEVFCNEEMTPEIGEVMPQVEEIAPKIHGVEKQITNKVKYVKNFEDSLGKCINALVDDYGRKHKSDLTRAEVLKKHGVFNDHHKEQFVQKRKEVYINSFVCSERYDVKNKILNFF